MIYLPACFCMVRRNQRTWIERNLRSGLDLWPWNKPVQQHLWSVNLIHRINAIPSIQIPSILSLFLHHCKISDKFSCVFFIIVTLKGQRIHFYISQPNNLVPSQGKYSHTKFIFSDVCVFDQRMNDSRDDVSIIIIIHPIYLCLVSLLLHLISLAIS